MIVKTVACRPHACVVDRATVKVNGVSTEQVTVITENLDNKIDTGDASADEILARVKISNSAITENPPIDAA